MLESQRTAILILGMHRSGTSALTRALNLLGAAAPKRLMLPNEWNPRGFWESKHLFAIHECLLTSVGSCWHDYQRLDPVWLETEAERQRHRERIKDGISQEFGESPSFVLKDPRICRFVPLILSILDELNARPVAVLQIRNPLEVAFSLRQRDGFTLPKSLLMWLRHVLDAEYSSRSIQRFFLHYESLLLDWRTCLRRMTNQLDLALPPGPNEFDEIDSFLTAELRRQRVSAEQLKTHPEIGSWIKDTYAIISRLAENGENRPDLDRLDLIRGKFDEACEVMGPALRETANLQATIQARAAECKALRQNLRNDRATSKSLRRKLTAENKALRREMQLRTEHFSLRAAKRLRALGAKLLREVIFSQLLLKS